MAIRQPLSDAEDFHGDEPDEAVTDSAQPPEERARLARLRTGDAEAYEAMFREFYKPLCAFVTRYVDSSHVAEELVEDLFVRLWEQRETIAVRGSLKFYLYGAARYQALNHRRHLAVQGRVLGRFTAEGVAPAMADEPVTADREVETEQLRAAIAAAIETLPERCRLVFILRWQHHLSYAEIAETLGISQKTVETQVNRAHKALRERLRPHW